jgi:hypothetical protein
MLSLTGRDSQTGWRLLWVLLLYEKGGYLCFREEFENDNLYEGTSNTQGIDRITLD